MKDIWTYEAYAKRQKINKMISIMVIVVICVAALASGFIVGSITPRLSEIDLSIRMPVVTPTVYSQVTNETKVEDPERRAARRCRHNEERPCRRRVTRIRRASGLSNR